MLDFGWSELLIIIAVAVLVIGPQDIPKIMRSLGRMVRRFQYMKFALTQQFEDFMQDNELTEIQKMAQGRTEGSVDEEIEDDEAYLAGFTAAGADEEGDNAADDHTPSKSGGGKDE